MDASKLFRINTYKSVSKQMTLSVFRMNTYAKPRGEGLCYCQGSSRPYTRTSRSFNFPTVSTRASRGGQLLSALLRPSTLNFRLSTPYLPRVRISIIPWNLHFFCFHTLTHSFALRTPSSLFPSTTCALFTQNTRVGVSLPLRSVIPSTARNLLSLASPASFQTLRISSFHFRVSLLCLLCEAQRALRLCVIFSLGGSTTHYSPPTTHFRFPV